MPSDIQTDNPEEENELRPLIGQNRAKKFGDTLHHLASDIAGNHASGIASDSIIFSGVRSERFLDCGPTRNAGPPPGMTDWESAAWLLQAKEFFEFGFGEDGHAKFFGFVVLRSGVCSDNYIVGLLADGAGNFPPVLLHDFASLFTASIRETPCEYKTLPGEFLALHNAFFRCRMHARLVQLLDELAIGSLRKKFHDARGDFRPHFRHFLKLLFFRRRQFLQRRKMFRQQLTRPLAHKLYAQRVNQPRQRLFLARLNLL